MQNTRRQTTKTGLKEESTFYSPVRVGNNRDIPATASSGTAVSGVPGGMGTSVADSQRAAWAPRGYEESSPVGQGGFGSSPEYDGGTVEGVGQQSYGSMVQEGRGDQATSVRGQYEDYGDVGGYLPPGQQQQPVQALFSCSFGVCTLRSFEVEVT